MSLYCSLTNHLSNVQKKNGNYISSEKYSSYFVLNIITQPFFFTVVKQIYIAYCFYYGLVFARMFEGRFWPKVITIKLIKLEILNKIENLES